MHELSDTSTSVCRENGAHCGTTKTHLRSSFVEVPPRRSEHHDRARMHHAAKISKSIVDIIWIGFDFEELDRYDRIHDVR